MRTSVQTVAVVTIETGGQLKQPLNFNQPSFVALDWKNSKEKEEFKISNKISMASNSFLLITIFCLLILGADLTFSHLISIIVTPMEMFTNEDPSAKEILEDTLKNIWLLLGIEITFLAFFCILSLFSVVAMGFASASRMNHNALISRTGRLWTRQVISWFCLTFIIVVCLALVLVVTECLVFVTDKAVIVVCLVFVIPGTLCYVYIAAVWMFSMIMSISEMDLTEIVIIEESENPVQGRRFQGFGLTLLTSFVSIGIAAASDKEMDSGKGNGVIILCYLCLFKFLMFGLYAAYYNDCKRRKGEGLDVEEGMDYAAAPAG